eukprot:3410338-Alexandrium_andersonii.AAC.1
MYTRAKHRCARAMQHVNEACVVILLECESALSARILRRGGCHPPQTTCCSLRGRGDVPDQRLWRAGGARLCGREGVGP